jgi:NTE family protein
MTMLPPGEVDLLPHTTVLDGAAAEWPDGLLICAARRDDGARVVFGRAGSPEATLGQAVAASCAIPGYFAPVEIDGVEYFDGGVHSPTNADVLRDHELDLVVAVSPMSAAHGRAPTAGGALRLSAHRRLQRELGRLRRRGTEVLCFEPDLRTLRAMGFNPMAEDRADAVIDAARAAVARRLRSPHLQGRLERLTAGSAAADAA